MTDIQQRRLANPRDWTHRPAPRPRQRAPQPIRHSPTPQPVSLLNPTGEFARQVDAVRRAREAEEAIPLRHLPRPTLVLRLWWFLPLLLLTKRCRHCGRKWPCRRLTKYLHTRHGDDIALAVFRLSTRRLRARADRRSRTAITHRPAPRRVDRRERALGLR